MKNSQRSRHHPSALAALMLLLAGQMLLTSCSTTEGFGKDVKNLGGGIEGSAARNK